MLRLLIRYIFQNKEVKQYTNFNKKRLQYFPTNGMSILQRKKEMIIGVVLHLLSLERKQSIHLKKQKRKRKKKKKKKWKETEMKIIRCFRRYSLGSSHVDVNLCTHVYSSVMGPNIYSSPEGLCLAVLQSWRCYSELSAIFKNFFFLDVLIVTLACSYILLFFLLPKPLACLLLLIVLQFNCYLSDQDYVQLGLIL